jgi:arylsulfatase A-like enzyme
MNKSYLILFALLLPLAVWAEAKNPNIILIMADDLGVEGLGCYGGTSYSTPRLDRMAAEGIRFRHAYSQPLCTNTRVQLMTAKYNHRNWLAFGLLDPREKTIGHWMREAGYKTAIVGKWQLQSYDPPDYPGADKRRGRGMHPEKTGFDEYCLWHTGHTEVKGSRYADPVIKENGRFRTDLKGKYGPDVWVNYINDYLKRQKGSKQPFFIYYPMALPHWPMMPTPDSPEWRDPKTRNQEEVRFIKDMVEYTDKCVGRIIDQVDALEMGRNTVVIFYSDNGTHKKVLSQTREGPVQGGKGNPDDAGTHVPLIVRWTGKVKRGVNNDLVDSTDFIPTLLQAAGKSVPAKAGLDGVSFYPRLLGQAGNPREWVYCYYDPRPGWDKDQFTLHEWARNHRWKLYNDDRLYDVANDPLEKRPYVASTDTPARRETRQILRAVLKRMKK